MLRLKHVLETLLSHDEKLSAALCSRANYESEDGSSGVNMAGAQFERSPIMSEQNGDGVMPIAIVGMGCRYPGGATSPEKLWEMCAEQRDAWSTIPKDRFNADEFYHPDPSRNGTVSIYLFTSQQKLAAWADK